LLLKLVLLLLIFEYLEFQLPTLLLLVELVL
jgi:hypothetical protein